MVHIMVELLCIRTPPTNIWLGGVKANIILRKGNGAYLFF